MIDFANVSIFSLDWVRNAEEKNNYIDQADELVAGKFGPFGGDLIPLDFSLPQPLTHWTKYGDSINGYDIKTFWEPARFTWAIPLCLAYTITNDEKYPHTFWKFFESFLEINPINLGPNWSSAQEVALRLIPWTMAGQAFVRSPQSTSVRMMALSDAIWQHCVRIPASLNYARSQHNNHLLSEALGLMIGGWLFKFDTRGQSWLDQGVKEFQNGIASLVDEDGTFSQHSTNYHRMLLHLSLIYQRIIHLAGLTEPVIVRERLDAATGWLAGMVDQYSGCASNLGHNDGTDLLPIGSNSYSDYQPTIQAASLAFIGKSCLPSGKWDHLADLLAIPKSNAAQSNLSGNFSPSTHRIGNEKTWASLRACAFQSRPAHADMLHTELWLNGINLALDAGTYAYNLPTPWDNSLARTRVHNTVMVGDQDQMIRISKFLWLKRVNAKIIAQSENLVSSQISVRQKYPYKHFRQLEFVSPDRFEVVDEIALMKQPDHPLPIRIQWLLPDWSWVYQSNTFSISDLQRHVQLEITADCDGGEVSNSRVSLIRAGEGLIGEQNDPIRGWVSKTYLSKVPALSFAVEYLTEKKIMIKSVWTLQ